MQHFVKRVIDITLSILILSILAPILLLISIFIRIDSNGSVLFKYNRVGKDGKTFISYKFRSMIEDAVSKGLGIETAEDDFRITSVGRVLRRFSLDELPQLINVLKADMSLVGPRPALPHQVEKYTDFEKKRLLVRPGITGWAQVNGRNLIPWKERIKLDVWYIDNWSLWLDFKILFLTPGAVLSKRGLFGEGGVVRDYE